MSSRTQPEMSAHTQARKPDNINTKSSAKEVTAKTT